MKVYVISLGAGLLVGVVYSLLLVRSPAPPIIALIGLLAHHRPERDLVLSKTIGQGFDMGRPSILDASADKKAGQIAATHVGGRCIPVMSGVIELVR